MSRKGLIGYLAVVLGVVMNRIEKKEFTVIMLSSTLNIIEKWRHFKLSKSIRDFYYKNTDHFIEDSEQEDIMLILASVAANADYLVTFNRKHLRNNSGKINSVLSKYGLYNIKVVRPNEI